MNKNFIEVSYLVGDKSCDVILTSDDGSVSGTIMRVPSFMYAHVELKMILETLVEAYISLLFKDTGIKVQESVKPS